jgi:hypothetical protein
MGLEIGLSPILTVHLKMMVGFCSKLPGAFEKQLLVCCYWALAETEHLTMGQQVSM